jgi:glycosyltransferase involved in cell wall biosynthesis
MKDMDDTSRDRRPAVSVCIPLYMKERFIAETIQSILDQSFTDFELAILHNASPDRSAEIAASFDDPRIRIVHNHTTLPGPENVIKVISLARADLVKVVAADDIMLPSALEKQVAVMADPGIAVVSCRQNMIDEHSEIIYPDRSLRTSDLLGRQDHTAVLRRVVRHGGNPVGAYVNMLFRRSAYEAAGGMPDVPWIAQDLALAVELLHHGDFYGMEETLVGFRIASGSASADDGSASIADQVRYIEDLRRNHPDIVRMSDAACSSLRMPVMRLRHRLIIAAAGPKGSVRTMAATRVLGMSRPTSS